jgi:hypothetical protein
LVVVARLELAVRPMAALVSQVQSLALESRL